MPDIAMCVGVQHYPHPHDFSEEAETQGVSKAISATNIPYIEPGRTRLALIHPRAVVTVTAKGMFLFDLGLELVNEFVDRPHDAEKDWLRAMVLAKMVRAGGEEVCNDLGMCYYLREADRKQDLDRLEEKYGIEYDLGFFGYTYVTEIQYVALDKEEELPDHLKGKGITIVRVTYEEVE